MIHIKKVIEKYCVDFLFPKECLACGTEGVNLCELCCQALRRLTEQLCPTCQRKTQGQTCLTCSKQSCLAGSLALLDYSDAQVRKLCNALKHEGITDIVDLFADDLIALLKQYQVKFDWIIPIPLSRTRKRERGYNQAELIAQEIAQKLNLPLKTGLLRRVRNTKPQQNLKRKQRLKNLKNAFAVSGRVQNKKILLVDDVTTSGATLTVCANLLKKSGAKEIYGLTLARGKLT